MRQAKDSYLISNSLSGLYSRDVGVDKNGFNTFFLQRFDGLRTGVVELSSLADLEGTRTQDEDLLGELSGHGDGDGANFGLSTEFQEPLKHEAGIVRAALGLRVKLDREERLLSMHDTFVGTVVGVKERGFPVRRKSSVVNGITMVLKIIRREKRGERKVKYVLGE